MSKIVFSSNPILGYAATESLNNDTWGSLLRDVVLSRPSEQEFAEACATAEAQAKEEMEDGQAMPGAWRSAKSVLKNAIKAGIPLLDAEGKPKGKSAIEAAIKAAKDAVTTEKSPEEKLEGLLNTAYDYAVKHGLDFFGTVDKLNTF